MEPLGKSPNKNVRRVFSEKQPTHKIESDLQRSIEEMLRMKGWHVERMHCSLYQQGIPDNFATHKLFGPRWIEVKRPDRTGELFTPAQLIKFPQFCSNGSGVWVLVAATEDEYIKLFKPYNWYHYLSSMRG